jgi:hypothetical protein
VQDLIHVPEFVENLHVLAVEYEEVRKFRGMLKLNPGKLVYDLHSMKF